MATKLGQKNPWCKLMMMMTFIEVKGHQRSNVINYALWLPNLVIRIPDVSLRWWWPLNVGFYIALFQYWSKRFTFNSVAIRILSAALQCPRHTHTFGRRSMDYIPSNYLITLRSTKQSRLSILPKDTNTLALAGLELTV